MVDETAPANAPKDEKPKRTIPSSFRDLVPIMDAYYKALGVQTKCEIKNSLIMNGYDILTPDEAVSGIRDAAKQNKINVSVYPVHKRMPNHSVILFSLKELNPENLDAFGETIKGLTQALSTEGYDARIAPLVAAIDKVAAGNPKILTDAIARAESFKGTSFAERIKALARTLQGHQDR